MIEFIYTALISILTNRINLDSQCDDAEVCKDIAAYIATLPYDCPYGQTLWEFINDHGEDTETIYLGRDAEGEKQYHILNPQTNWHERIRKNLAQTGYYKRYSEWLTNSLKKAA